MWLFFILNTMAAEKNWEWQPAPGRWLTFRKAGKKQETQTKLQWD